MVKTEKEIISDLWNKNEELKKENIHLKRVIIGYEQRRLYKTKKQIALSLLNDRGLSAIVHRSDGTVKGEIELCPSGGYYDSWDDIIKAIK